MFKVSESKLAPAVGELVRVNSTVLGSSLSLIVVVDSSPCTTLLAETVWWKEWQSQCVECGFGFALATCRADSADLVVTARLDGVGALVLVFPSAEDGLSGLGVPDGALPLKLMIDSTGHIERVWGPIMDIPASRQLKDHIESICSADSL